jgi:hypothetical protein
MEKLLNTALVMTFVALFAVILMFTATKADEGVLTFTDNGFMFPTSKSVKTFYKGKIIWGKGYTDHNKSSPVKGIAVVAWSNSDKWKYVTTTNDKGEFLIQVMPSSAFNLKASDGDRWSVYGKILKGVPLGTVGEGK